MSDTKIRICVEDAEAEILQKMLSDSGVTVERQYLTQAREGAEIVAVLVVLLAPEVARCVRTYLQTCGKRMVTRYGDKIVIRGNFSADEIARLLEVNHDLKIEDDK